MEFRDYLRMVKRGWPAIFLITAFFVAASVAYLVVSPKTYQARAVVYVSARGPQSIGDLQQGSQFVGDLVTTYAEIADSAVVLEPVSQDLDQAVSVDELSQILTSTVRPNTNLIDLQVDADSPAKAQQVANAVAATMKRVIPRLESGGSVRSSRPTVRIEHVEQAKLPAGPISPDRQEIMALGLIVGLTLGLGLTILVQSMGRRIRRVHDVRRVTDLPLLGAIPQRGLRERGSLIARDSRNSAAVEAFRTLRTNLRFLNPSARRVVLITSTVEDSQEPDVAANIAWSLADSGFRVAVVDADLRHPRLAKVFAEAGSIGLADVLGARVSATDALQDGGHPRLSVLSAGTASPNGNELLGSRAMRDLLDELARTFDFVVVRAPALLSDSDAAVLAVSADLTVLGVVLGRTKSTELAAALTALGTVGVEPAGIIMTRAPHAGLGVDEQLGSPHRRLSTGSTGASVGAEAEARSGGGWPRTEPDHRQPTNGQGRPFEVGRSV